MSGVSGASCSVPPQPDHGQLDQGRVCRRRAWRWLGAALLALCALPGAAHAESGRKSSSGAKAPSTPVEPMTVMDAKATATFKEGLAAFDRRDFEAARVAFLQTFALKPGAAVVRRNLGLAEIYSGHYLEGARRLARVLHTTDEGSLEDRARMQESLKKAEAHLERVSVEIRQEGAEILIDGVDLGASPLPFLWYVAPGAYDVRVQKAGFVEHAESRVAHAGVAQHLVIMLAPVREEPPAKPLPVPVDAKPPAGPNGWLLLGGGVLTAAALATGAAFSIAASNNADKVSRLDAELGDASCGSPPTPLCEELSNAAQTHDRQQRLALVSFTTAGLTGIATLLYGLLGGGGETGGGSHEDEPMARLQRSLSAGWAGAGPSLFWSGDF